MKAYVSGNEVVIKLPVNTLVTAFNYKEDNQDVYRVKYRKKFAKGICDYILSHTNEYESGLTAFQSLLDEIFDEMTIELPNYIKELNPEE